MGTTCSHGVVTALGEESSTSPASSNGSTVTQTTSTKTIQSPWNPFNITVSEAEELLKASDPGSFVFSHDLTSELFLSLSVGKYVCHHSVVTRRNAYYVGARKFSTIGEVIEYFKDHPLGEITLKEEFKPLPTSTSVVQVKQHPDFSFQSTVIPSTSESSSSDGDITKNNLLLPHHQAFNEKSPVQIRRPLNQRTPVERIEEESKNYEEKDDIVEENNEKNRKKVTLQIPKNKVAPLPKKPLTRSGAIDQTESSSSGADREVPSSISLVPIIPQDCVTTTTQLYS